MTPQSFSTTWHSSSNRNKCDVGIKSRDVTKKIKHLFYITLRVIEIETQSPHCDKTIF